MRAEALDKDRLGKLGAKLRRLTFVDTVVESLRVDDVDGDTIEFPRRLDSEPLVHHVPEDESRVAIERIAEAAAA